MKTIILDNEKVKIPVATERALRLLAVNNFFALKSIFYEGSDNFRLMTVPSDPDVAAQLGMFERKKSLGDKLTKREQQFFADNPRISVIVTGDKKIITSILAQLDG